LFIQILNKLAHMPHQMHHAMKFLCQKQTFDAAFITSRTSTSTLTIWRNMTRLVAYYVVAIFNQWLKYASNAPFLFYALVCSCLSFGPLLACSCTTFSPINSPNSTCKVKNKTPAHHYILHTWKMVTVKNT